MPNDNRPTVEEIKNWLEAHGALDKFIANYNSRPRLETLDEHIEHEGQNIIMRSFVIAKAPERGNYWFNIYRKYQHWYYNFQLGNNR